MKIRLLFIILLVFGGVLTANLIIDNRTLSSVELDNVRTVCLGCHGLVPNYEDPLKVHNNHAAFECSRCHGDNSGIKTTDNLHNGLEWLGIGTMLFSLTGVITNILIINRKGRVD